MSLYVLLRDAVCELEREGRTGAAKVLTGAIGAMLAQPVAVECGMEAVCKRAMRLVKRVLRTQTLACHILCSASALSCPKFAEGYNKDIIRISIYR